jgi:hypothetical protein
VAAIGIVEPQNAVGQAEEVFSENTTFAQESPSANQTAAPTPSTNPFILTDETGTQNQTQMALDNLTRVDFALVTSALDSARDSILANSSQDAYTFLNDADNELFKTAQANGPSAMKTIIKITDPMRNNIDNAQEALHHGDLPNAMKERNSAEVELVRITQGLPTVEEVPPADVEEPPSDEADPSADEEE